MAVEEIKDAWPAALAVAPVIIYKLYQTLKQDNKGDTVDSRIDTFTKTLQASLDKAILSIDTLQKERAILVPENALLKAKLTIAESEIVRLQKRLGEAPPQGTD